MNNTKIKNIITLTVTAVALAAGFAVMCAVLVYRAYSKFELYDDGGIVVNMISEGKMLIPFITFGVLVIISAVVIAGISYRAPHLGEAGMRKRMKELEKTDTILNANKPRS
ncbi:hypothetical protein FACS18949_16440 [Clostridia bacterium]|nr:hypothetical protein FACS18949_16440 [Clostridia bacterium]